MNSVEEMIAKLEKQTNISKEELNNKIIKKQKELSGMVSFEGAAQLIAKELGINPFENKKIEMKNIVSGMKNVNVTGRIFKISNMVEFKKGDGTGKVVNVYIGDSTGYVKLALWNEQVSIVEEEIIKPSDIIQIVNGMAKENVYGDIEVVIGKYGNLKQIEEQADLPTVNELNKMFSSNTIERTAIMNATPGIFEICCNIVYVFKGNFIFNICPVCGNSLDGKDSKFRCMEHGEVDPNPALVISTIVDDGTGDIRTVFFRNTAEKLIDATANEIVRLDQENKFKTIKEKLIGRNLILRGRVKKNKLFNRMEMIVNDFEDLNTLNESKKLIEEIELKIGE